MKKFFKFFSIIAAIFTAVIGALTVFDRLLKRKGENTYLECGNNNSLDGDDE